MDKVEGNEPGSAAGSVMGLALPEEPSPAGDGPRAGHSPARPLLEIALVFAAFWLTAWLPGDASLTGAALARPIWHLYMALELIPKALLLLYLMWVEDGFAAFGGIGKPKRRDLLAALVVAGGALTAALVPGQIASLLIPSLKNPLLEAAVHPTASAYLLVPAIILSCAAVGYAEELFFRVFLLHRLTQAGLSTAWAALAAILLFAASHGLQGELGLMMGAILGSWFVWRRLQGSGLHELAWGHGLYDAAVILITLYAVK